MPNRVPPTVLLADDNARIAAVVERVLGDEYHVLGLALDGMELLEMAERLLPDVIVADIGMPRLNGIDAVKRLKLWKSPAVVFLTSHGDLEMVDRALASGALGYVLKTAAAEELAPAIESALRGEVFISEALLPAGEDAALAK